MTQVLGVESGHELPLPPRHLKLAAVVLAGGQDEYTTSMPLSALADSFIHAGIDDVVMWWDRLTTAYAVSWKPGGYAGS